MNLNNQPGLAMLAAGQSSCYSSFQMTVEINYAIAITIVIGLKILHQLFSQWELTQNPTAACTRNFSRALNKLQIIAGNSDWLFALLTPVVIGQSNYFGIGFSTVIWKPLYLICCCCCYENFELTYVLERVVMK